MNLNLTRPVVFFDIEATGLNVATDRIVELSLLKVDGKGSEVSVTMRFNPEMHISDEASKVNGIYDADVANCPVFKEKAAEVAAFFEGADMAGFNSLHFDLPLLVEELLRAGINFDASKCRMVDVQGIFHKMEKRTLSAAYKFYCGKELENAHTALADTMATYEVLKAQLDKYGDDLKNDIDFLADFSSNGKNADLAGRISYNEQGQEIINFGKFKGQVAEDVLRRNPSYYEWMMRGDFTRNTKQVLTRIWLRTRGNAKD